MTQEGFGAESPKQPISDENRCVNDLAGRVHLQGTAGHLWEPGAGQHSGAISFEAGGLGPSDSKH